MFATITNRGRISESYRPILPFCLDFPGSKGSGYYGHQRLLDSKNGRIENLRAHGFLLLNPDTKNKLEPDENMRFGNYDIHFKSLARNQLNEGVRYVSKTIESSRLLNLDLSQSYLFFSRTREAVTPGQLASLQIRCLVVGYPAPCSPLDRGMAQ